jgi:putative acetyltransferase
MFEIRPAHPQDRERLFDIWHSAVSATHNFLSAAHFAEIAELVRDQYLPVGDFLVAADRGDVPHGFLGATENRIDALFVHADSRGAGIGRLLVRRILDAHGEVTVDVNEQNVSGRGFYERLGFQIYDRSDQDDQGRPYPLLHLRWISQAR